MRPTREDAWALVCEFVQNENLRRHMLAVEAAMRAYARKFGEDEERWGIVGLVHDFDYERYSTMGGDLPKEEWHTFAGANVLRKHGWPEEIVQDLLSHADYAGVPRDTLLRKALYAVDELTGLLVAVALVRPNRSILDVQLNSVRKKWKDKAFAAAVNRKEIERASADLGVDLNEHIQLVLDAMKGIAPELGLAGEG
jgi:putative nucleotidyltransferase with HDIG domain